MKERKKKLKKMNNKKDSVYKLRDKLLAHAEIPNFLGTLSFVCLFLKCFHFPSQGGSRLKETQRERGA